jgi:sulfite exporter TauE/SafE
MTFETFETVSLYVLVGLLVAYMGFIVWDLAKRSNAGKFGTTVLFLALGLGVFGFIAKTIFVEFMGI